MRECVASGHRVVFVFLHSVPIRLQFYVIVERAIRVAVMLNKMPECAGRTDGHRMTFRPFNDNVFSLPTAQRTTGTNLRA